MSLPEIKHKAEELRSRKRTKPLSCSSGIIVTIGGRQFRKHFGFRCFDEETERWFWGVTPSYTEVISREEEYERARPGAVTA